MEVYMRGIPFSMEQTQLKELLASVFHSRAYSDFGSQPLNFDVRIHRRRTKHHTKSGIMTVHAEAVGEQFLREYQDDAPIRKDIFDTIYFERGKRSPNRRVLKAIRELPYNPPSPRSQPVHSTVPIARLQFGWYCTDEQYSVEWEKKFPSGLYPDLSYNIERRQFQLTVKSSLGTLIVAMRLSQIYWAAASPDQSGEPSIFFYLHYPPSFETESLMPESTSGLSPLDRRLNTASAIDASYRSPFSNGSIANASSHARGLEASFTRLSIQQRSSNPIPNLPHSSPRGHRLALPSLLYPHGANPLFGRNEQRARRRAAAFDDSHLPIAPFTSIAIRLVCLTSSAIAAFHRLCRVARLSLDSSPPPVVHRGLFSQTVRETYKQWITALDFAVAFQVEAIVTQWLTHMKEAIELLRPVVNDVISSQGPHHASLLLADLRSRLEARVWYGDGVDVDENTTRALLITSLSQLRSMSNPMIPHDDLFYCNHLSITASSMILAGPFVERSNRVIRQFWDNRDSFLRVHFYDDNRLAYRFDAEIDLDDIIDKRVRHFLLNGVTIAGRHFQFLGYSQSALKSHSVWFVRPFRTADDGPTINAASIIAGLGNFAENPYDQRLIYCPARYAARISQAFSATESSITIAVEDMEIVEDIMDATGAYSFTDGNGTMSLQLARDIAADQRKKSRVRRAWRMHDSAIPRVMQVRIAGSKGMLHVDHRLEGRKIRLPKSMVKFNAPSNRMEIAQLFEEPSPFYLNRPMIMLLEGLGVPYETFKRLQDSEVRAVHALTESLSNSGWLLDKYGLGNSFKLPSTILHLHKLGVPVASLNVRPFWSRMMTFALNHVLREIKYHARIPVPGGWTLVGVADMHGQLCEGEIYVRVRTRDGRETYLEGPALVTRSPAIHPGDIQVLHAIGKPPEGSDLALGELKNCIVFPIKGNRPLPSYFGGGDLDGDMYNVTTVPIDLLPPRHKLQKPASYTAAKRKYLNRPSTMKDVANFVAQFIVSDNIGLVASTWLVLADKAGIFDHDCLRLAELHNAAVDYPKTGLPVPMSDVRPIQRRVRNKPDWYRPEAALGRPPTYYESTSALGKLFRAIDLPDQEERSNDSSYFELPEIDEDDTTLQDVLADINGAPLWHRAIMQPVVDEVRRYLPSCTLDERLVTSIWHIFTAYASRLRGICAAHAVSASRSCMLSEEEVVVGTISAKCAQVRKRTDMTAKMREQSATLVNGICAELSGNGEMEPVEHLRQAWAAYRVSCALSRWFGGQSFGWIALGEIFDAIREIKEEEEEEKGEDAT